MTPALKSNNNANSAKTIKFLYSYGGKIVPRQTDGKLRYVGGYTRVLAVDRSVTFAELMVRFGELCGSSMSLKCKLPTEDLDVLVSISSDEDLANIIDEYDRFSSVTHKELKIRAVLFPLESVKKISPPTSPVSSVDLSATTSPPCRLTKLCSETAASERYWSGGRNTPAVLGFPPAVRKDTAKFPYYGCCYQGSPRVFHRIPLWSLWQ